MTIQDLIYWCAQNKTRTHPDGYPLSAKLLLGTGEDAEEPIYELRIAGCEGHGHEWEEPERIYLTVKRATTPEEREGEE